MNRRKRIFSAAMAIVLALTMLSSVIVVIVTSVKAQAVSQTELDALRAKAEELAEQKSEIGEKISELQSQRASIVERKNMLDANIELTRQEIENLTEQIALLEEDIAEKTRQYELAVSEEESQTELFRRRVREMEEDGEVSYVETIFQADSFSELLSIMDSITDIMNYDEWVVEQLHKAQELTLEAKGELEDAKAVAEDSKAAQQEKQGQLEQELAEADELMAAVEADLENNQAEYDEIEQAESEAASRIDSMVAELERLEEERRRREQQTTSTNVSASGTYIWPSASSVYVTSLFGTRLHPVYKTYRTHYGVDIGASYGTNVLAADGGTVVTSQYSSSYGNYIMISHGNGNYTLYAHMSSRIAEVGDNVSQGQVIGLVGSTGISTGPHIHFEVYQGGTRVNPLQFFSNYVITGW